jgi:hypothetical protein
MICLHLVNVILKSLVDHEALKAAMDVGLSPNPCTCSNAYAESLVQMVSRRGDARQETGGCNLQAVNDHG